MNSEKRLTTGDVMKYCVVSRSTVLKWIKSNKLNAYLHPHGQYRIPEAALVAFLKENNMPIDKELIRETLEHHDKVKETGLKGRTG